MKRNEDKSHVMLSSQLNVQVNIGTAQIENRKCQKLFDINIYSKLKFEDHKKRIFKKSGTH